MELDNNTHSVFLLYYHLILVVKYRRTVFDEVLSNRAKEIFMYIAPNYHITLQEWNADKDHVHILFKAQNQQVYQCLQKCKQSSAKKGVSLSAGKTVERIFLEPKFLLINDW